MYMYPCHRQSKDKFISAASSDGFGFCSVILFASCSHLIVILLIDSHRSGWDLHDTVYSRELKISNRENGYRDLLAVIDISTFRRIPWENNVPFFLVSFLDPDTKESISVCPRGVLRRAVEKVDRAGWQCMAGIEFEASAYTLIASVAV